MGRRGSVRRENLSLFLAGVPGSLLEGFWTPNKYFESFDFLGPAAGGEALRIRPRARRRARQWPFQADSRE